MHPQESLERKVATALAEKGNEAGRDLHGALPIELSEQLRGMVIGVCNGKVVIDETLRGAESRAKEQGWKNVRFIPGPPKEDMTLAELEGRQE